MLVGVVVAVGEATVVAEGVSVLVVVAVAVEEGLEEGEGVRLRVVVAVVVGEGEGVALRVLGGSVAVGVTVLVAVTGTGRGGRVSVGIGGGAGRVGRGVMVGQRICEKAVGDGVFLDEMGCVDVPAGVNPPGVVGDVEAAMLAAVGEAGPLERAPKGRER